MTQNIIVIDFSGTLIKPNVAEDANLKRYDILNIPRPSVDVHKQHHGNKGHYDIIKEKIQQDYGLSDDLSIGYVQNKGEDISLSVKEIKTMMMTDLFRNAMYAVAKERGKDIFNEGFEETLIELKKRNYSLAIVSGIRRDIIEGLLAITGFTVSFDYIRGQDPILSRDSNDFMMNNLSKEGRITHIVGDKLSDLEPALELHAIPVFFKGGHPTGGEEEFAKHTINSAKDLLDIIR